MRMKARPSVPPTTRPTANPTAAPIARPRSHHRTFRPPRFALPGVSITGRSCRYNESHAANTWSKLQAFVAREHESSNMGARARHRLEPARVQNGYVSSGMGGHARPLRELKNRELLKRGVGRQC